MNDQPENSEAVDELKERHHARRSSLAGFLPRCPSCRYDLRGLPDGHCPECGEAFEHEALVDAELEQRSRRREAGHAALIGALAVAMMPCFWANSGPVSLLVLGFMWVLAATWIGQHWRLLTGDGAVFALWLIIPIARTGISFVGTPAAFPFAAFSAAGLVLVVRHSYRSAPAVTILLLGAAIGLPLLIFGLAGTIEGIRGVQAGHYWSEWNYPPVEWIRARGDPRVPHVMLYRDKMWAGLAALMLAIVALGAAALALRSWGRGAS